MTAPRAGDAGCPAAAPTPATTNGRPPSPLLALPGAVPADPPDAGVAAHYGDPYREQRHLELGGGLVDLSHRDVIRVSGPDRLSWLHALTTQHLTALAPGVATEALVLSPHGHIEHALYAVDDGEALWAHVEPGTAAALVAFLDRMRFLLRVEVETVTDDYAVVWAPRRRDELDAVVVREDVGGDVGSDVGGDVGRDVGGGGTGSRGADHLLPRAALPSLPDVDRLAGVWAHEALRIAARRPRVGLETDHRTIPHELGWLDTAVHLDKGCYRGQETVARVHNLGRPPRRLVLLHLDGSVDRLPAHGTPVVQGDRPVGFVGSAARHHELGPIALALVKRSTPTDAELLADGVPAAQEVVVPA